MLYPQQPDLSKKNNDTKANLQGSHTPDQNHGKRGIDFFARTKKWLGASVVALGVLGCNPTNPPSIVDAGVPMDAGPSPSAENGRSVTIHTFANYKNPQEAEKIAEVIKANVLGSADAPTCYMGPDGKIFTVGVQLEPMTIPECVALGPDCASTVNERVKAFTDKGLPVTLLLGVHQHNPNGDYGQTVWAPGGTFVPYQPNKNEAADPYTVIFDNFHGPILDGLATSGLIKNVDGIFAANEFTYPDKAIDTAKDWGNADNWQELRQDALLASANRLVEKTRAKIPMDYQNQIFVGIKLPAHLNNIKKGWAAVGASLPDPLLSFVTNVSGPQKPFRLGFDSYPQTVTLPGNFDQFGDLPPIEHAINNTPGTTFEFAEFAAYCVGAADKFQTGERTNKDAILGASQAWASANPRNINIFALSTGLNPPQGCFSLWDEASPNFFSDTASTIEGIKDFGATWIGVNSLGEALPCK